MKPTEETLAAQRRLGATPERLQAILQHPKFEDCQRLLAELKAEVKVNFKRLARQLHPDLHNDEGMARELATLTQVRAALLDLKIERKPPPQPFGPTGGRVVVIQVVQPGFTVSYGTGFGFPGPGTRGTGSW